MITPPYPLSIDWMAAELLAQSEGQGGFKPPLLFSHPAKEKPQQGEKELLSRTHDKLIEQRRRLAAEKHQREQVLASKRTALKHPFVAKNHYIRLPMPSREKAAIHHALLHYHIALYRAGMAAERVMQEVGNTMHHLRYTYYKLGGTYFNTFKGIYGVDCSDYVDHMLNNADPSAYQSLEHWTRSYKPTSEDYYVFFDDIPTADVWHYWYKVPAVDRLEPGDILVFRYKELRGRDAAGHVMIVVNQPTPDRYRPNAYLVRVSDSAPVGHSDDTRPIHTSGIGIGTLLLKVNPRTGQPEAYAWSLAAPWQYDMDFAMARPMNIFSMRGHAKGQSVRRVG